MVGIDLETGTEKSRFRVPGNLTGLCWDASRFWYSDYTNRLIRALSPS